MITEVPASNENRELTVVATTMKSVEWKAVFLSKPSISIRKGIAFAYNPPLEVTSTLVLTAPSGKFVDIRFPRQMSYTRSGQPVPLSSHTLFWAFSGLSETTFYEQRSESRPGFAYTAHTVFHHDIDSKGPGITDEGDCFLLPNGDVMEIGLMHGTNQLYKEYWTEPEPLPGRKALVKRPIVVAETVRAVTGRGIVIRIGDYIQGIFERANVPDKVDKVLVHRLTRRTFTNLDDEDTQQLKTLMAEMGLDDTTDNDEIWLPDLRANARDSTMLPCELFTHISPQAVLGAKFVCGSNQWQITEFEV